MTWFRSLLYALAVGAATASATAQTPGPEQAAAQYQRLRTQALTVSPESFGLGVPADRRAAYGVVMETRYPEVTVTVVAYSHGDASLYASNGGGVIGGFAHKPVAAAAVALVAEAQTKMGSMARAPDFPAPAVNNTRFYVLTSQGAYAAEAPEAALEAGAHPLSPLYRSGHLLVAELRKIHAEHAPPPR